ncbi:ABC transporter ATP-binding protein [Synechococcus sp. RSCCF101]|nr:ABC transporter ATP-binding protein [Synechococcus sp. RSCCF101]
MTVQDLWHRYTSGGDWTIAGLSLDLAPGELVGLLGPSGCGKTTLLRLIAGFECPSRGTVRMAGRDVAGAGRWLPPERRRVGMVFQDYALFPHLDAWANACFGLRAGADRDRVRWLLELLGLEGLARRYPHELSGGQRQRLALVRALAPRPAVLLLDEPFSNLDVEVRLRLRSELQGVLRECGTSGLLVTHDPEEALAVCDRVAVLEKGVLQQCATPHELVARPATPFVGRFVLQGNLLPAGRDGGGISTPLGPMQWLEPPAVGAGPAAGSSEVLIAQADVAFTPSREGRAEVMGREFLGQDWRYQVRCDALRLRLRLPLSEDLPRGCRGDLSLRQGARGQLFCGGEPLPVMAVAAADPSPD